MDISSVIGVVVATCAVLYTLMAGGSVMLFWDPAAMVITYGGATACMFLAFPLKTMLNTMKITRNVFFAPKLDMIPSYTFIVELATVARRDGILALEERINGVEDKMMKRGLQLLVDGSPVETVKAILEKEIENLEKRHEIGHKYWEKLGYFGPAIGMVGTLIGLVQMLANLNDPSKIGPGMAVALLTTFYGALLANFVALPIENKLIQRTNEELLLKYMIMEGMLSIQCGDSPRVVGEKLLVFLSPEAQDQITEQSAKK